VSQYHIHKINRWVELKTPDNDIEIMWFALYLRFVKLYRLQGQVHINLIVLYEFQAV